MLSFLFLIFTLLFFIIVICFGFEMSMGLCLDYWSDKQYRIWKIICALIGISFLIALVFLCIFSSERFSDQMMKQSVILLVAAYFSMGTFSQILHFIAWKKKCDILKDKIRVFLHDTGLKTEKDHLLEICIFENQDYSKKTVKRIFNKVFLEFNHE